ncbi:hypothetical protein [Oceanisphaera sp.]
MSEKVLSVYGRIVVSIFTWARIVSLFKAGVISAVSQFLFLIILLKAA